MDNTYRVQVLNKQDAFVRMALPIQKIKAGITDSAEKLELEAVQLARQAQMGIKEDLKPKDNEYLFTVFRGISQVYIPGYAIDLREPGVLEAAVPMFKGLKLFRNHIMLTENIIGYVPKGWWDDSKDFSAPGINVNPVLDTVLGWQEARQLLSDPPLLDSVSIGFRFKYKRSHEDMNWWTFYEMLGKEVDGEIVRFIVTEITAVRELSLVWAGADELAKGGIIEINEALKQMLKAEGVAPAEEPEETGAETFESLNDNKNGAHVPETEQPKPTGGHMSELIIKNPALLAVKLGKQEISSESQLLELVDALVQENARLKPAAADGEQYLQDVRTEAIRLAALVYGNGEDGYKASEQMQSLINKACLAEAKELVKSYQAVLDKKLPGRRSSEEELDDPAKPQKTVDASKADISDDVAVFNAKVAELEKAGHTHAQALALAAR